MASSWQLPKHPTLFLCRKDLLLLPYWAASEHGFRHMLNPTTLFDTTADTENDIRRDGFCLHNHVRLERSNVDSTRRRCIHWIPQHYSATSGCRFLPKWVTQYGHRLGCSKRIRMTRACVMESIPWRDKNNERPHTNYNWPHKGGLGSGGISPKRGGCVLLRNGTFVL